MLTKAIVKKSNKINSTETPVYTVNERRLIKRTKKRKKGRKAGMEGSSLLSRLFITGNTELKSGNKNELSG